jgi:hypothetical protein
MHGYPEHEWNQLPSSQKANILGVEHLQQREISCFMNRHIDGADFQPQQRIDLCNREQIPDISTNEFVRYLAAGKTGGFPVGTSLSDMAQADAEFGYPAEAANIRGLIASSRQVTSENSAPSTATSSSRASGNEAPAGLPPYRLPMHPAGARATSD